MFVVVVVVARLVVGFVDGLRVQSRVFYQSMTMIAPFKCLQSGARELEIDG